MAEAESFQEIRGVMRQLVESWERDKSRTMAMKAAYDRGVGPMVWSLTHHTVRLSRAILDLTKQGEVLVAVPLMRLCIDNAMTAAWLVAADGATGALIHEGLRQRKAAIDGTVKRGENHFDEDAVANALRELDEFSSLKLAEGQSLERRFEALKGGGQMYGIYRIAASLSHAGMALADQYLQTVPVTPETPVGVALVPDEVVDPKQSRAWLGMTGIMLALAMAAWDTVDAEGRQRSQVARAAKRLGTHVSIELADRKRNSKHDAS